MSPEAPNSAPQEFGPVVGAIIIVLLLVVGGMYFFFMQQQKLNSPEEPLPLQGTSTDAI